jgi:hypothetical protein
MAKSIDIRCPQCGRLYHTDESHLGKSIRCVQCGKIILLIVAEPLASEQTRSPGPEVQSRPLTFRRWWTNRRPSVFRSASSGQASASSAKHPARRLRPVYGFGLAATVVVVAAVLLLHVRPYTPHMPDIAEPPQSQLKQQPDSLASEPAVRQGSLNREAVANADTRSQNLDPRPTNYNSPPTGTRIEEDVGNDGHGKLTVENGTDEDAVVRLSDAATDQTVRWFFVRAHTSAHLAHIPQGTDRLTFTTGLNWIESEDTFSWHPSYSEFERAFTYIEERDSEEVQYHSISVTLHPVPSGNVKTKAISREAFLKGHRHVALRRP